MHGAPQLLDSRVICVERSCLELGKEIIPNCARSLSGAHEQSLESQQGLKDVDERNF